MKCEECQQNPATLHFTKIINGEKTEIHLCDQCAREKGEVFTGGSGFSVNNLLSGLLNMDTPFKESTNHSFTSQQSLQCETCGMTYDKFSKIGRFGCADCYKTFGDKLDPILRRVHSGNTVHAGKLPKRIGGDLHVKKEITHLKEEMQTCIANEEFERAAELRDKIRALEKNLIGKREGD
ncbi:UvrB/UvrC motif-containing protein [Bacillus tianshenii]|nr:UvrB/UvrC motif-containing protein [Bacillus tianshenii]